MSCSGRLAPTIGAVIAGFDRTHATAIVVMLMPALMGKRPQRVDGFKLPCSFQ